VTIAVDPCRSRGRITAVIAPGRKSMRRNSSMCLDQFDSKALRKYATKNSTGKEKKNFNYGDSRPAGDVK